MHRITKQIIAGIVTLFVLFVAVWGSYLPMRKAEMFIGALQSMQTQPVSSLGDLEGRFSPPLNAPSPIGQEEIVRNLANSVLGFVQGNQNASSTQELLSYLFSYYDPILARGKGMSFGQDLYLVGAINEMAFVRTGDPAYLAASKQYYSEAVELGPNRPQALYGLFDVYRFLNDMPDAESTAKTILTDWPTDQNIKQGLATLEAKATSSTVPSTPSK
jgi:hypothetical protein